MPLSLSPFDAAAGLIVLSALLGWINHRYLRLPGAVALTLMGALASLGVIAADAVFQGSNVSTQVSAFLDGVDFHDTLMNGMLSFLLFAGALHVDLEHLRRGRWRIAVLSTVGVAVSAVLVGLAP